MTAQVHAMYPWATQISTADGGMKNKYNLAQGTTLQPLQPLQPPLNPLQLPLAPPPPLQPPLAPHLPMAST